MSELPEHIYPRVSIVVPSFNAGKTIERTLRSLLEQDYPDLQLIVMDGGSKDNTVQVLNEYKKFIDICVSEPDDGQVDALNKGFSKADGEIFGWLCADDELLPDALKKLARVFVEKREVDVVTSGCRRYFSNGTIISTTPDPSFLEELDYRNTIEQPSTLWRSHAHRAAGQLDASYRYAFDWEFWCRLKSSGAVFHAIPDKTSIYHFSPENLTSTGGRKIAAEMYRVVKNYGPYNGRLADAYWFLYRVFDLNGYYDRENRGSMSKFRRITLYLALAMLYSFFDSRVINSYNWNFASRQERGLDW